MKTSTYHNPAHCLLFKGACVYLNMTVEIDQLSEQINSYGLRIISTQLAETDQDFVIWLCLRLTEQGVKELETMLNKLLVEDLTPILFTLFYSGNIKENANA